MPSETRVSVVIPTYNSSQWLSQAIDSVLAQGDCETEIIIVDDGSTDSSREIAASYNAVRLLEQSHQGANHARNFGLHNCTGEFVKFLDSDDFLEPGILLRQVAEASGRDKRIIVYSDIRYFEEGSGMSTIESVRLPSGEEQIYGLLKENIPTPAPLHRRQALLKVGGFDDRVSQADEYILHLRLALSGSIFHYLPGIGTHVRQHGSPHRISNRPNDEISKENSSLRSEIYLELFRGRFGSDIPSPIRRHFASGAFEGALVDFRRKDLGSARRRISYALQYEPSLLDFFIGAMHGASKVARSQISKRFAVRRSGSP